MQYNEAPFIHLGHLSGRCLTCAPVQVAMSSVKQRIPDGHMTEQPQALTCPSVIAASVIPALKEGDLILHRLTKAENQRDQDRDMLQKYGPASKQGG